MAIKKYKTKDGRWNWKYDIGVGKHDVDYRRLRESGFQSAEECRDAVAAIKSDFKRGKYKFKSDQVDITILDLKKALLKKLEGLQRSKSTINQYTRVLDGFAELYPNLRIEGITSEHVDNYYAHRLNQPTVSANTAVDDLLFLMSSLRRVRELFPLLKDWNPPRHEPVKKVNAYRERVITKEEEQKIIAALHDPDWYANDDTQRKEREVVAFVFWMALRTGMRIGEILGLKKSAISFNKAPGAPNGWITVKASHTNEKTKNRKHRIVKMTQNVATALKARVDVASDYVFESYRKQGFPSHWILRSFAKACNRAKIPYGQETDGGIVFHDTRHTAATRMAMSGTDIKTIGKTLGHGDAYITLRYLHSTNESELAGMQSLDDGAFSVQNVSNSGTYKTELDNTVRKEELLKTVKK
jgi:integrase